MRTSLCISLLLVTGITAHHFYSGVNLKSCPGAMQVLHQWANVSSDTSYSLGADACAAMSNDHKQALALELARCHTEPLGRLMFQQGSSDCSRPMQSTPQLHLCLSEMTHVGHGFYADFFMHVYMSCSRSIQDQVTRQSQAVAKPYLAHAKLQLVQAHHAAAEHLHEFASMSSDVLDYLADKVEARKAFRAQRYTNGLMSDGQEQQLAEIKHRADEVTGAASKQALVEMISDDWATIEHQLFPHCNQSNCLDRLHDSLPSTIAIADQVFFPTYNLSSHFANASDSFPCLRFS